MSHTIYPCALRIESHPTGCPVNVVLDLNEVNDTIVSLTRDLALQLRHQLDRL